MLIYDPSHYRPSEAAPPARSGVVAPAAMFAVGLAILLLAIIAGIPAEHVHQIGTLPHIAR
jgi:hypothetical protein